MIGGKRASSLPKFSFPGSLARTLSSRQQLNGRADGKTVDESFAAEHSRLPRMVVVRELPPNIETACRPDQRSRPEIGKILTPLDATGVRGQSGLNRRVTADQQGSTGCEGSQPLDVVRFRPEWPSPERFLIRENIRQKVLLQGLAHGACIRIGHHVVEDRILNFPARLHFFLVGTDLRNCFLFRKGVLLCLYSIHLLG